jgi:hypothetical protein
LLYKLLPMLFFSIASSFPSHTYSFTFTTKYKSFYKYIITHISGKLVIHISERSRTSSNTDVYAIWLLCVLPYIAKLNYFWTSGRQSMANSVLWRASNLTSFSPCLTGPVDNPFASCHEGPRFKTPGGYLCETGGFSC